MGYFEFRNNPWESDRMKARFQKRLAKIIPARWHMTLICFTILACGILLVAVCTAIFGSSIYFIYQAPEILFEAAFEGVLVASLFCRGKKL